MSDKPVNDNFQGSKSWTIVADSIEKVSLWANGLIGVLPTLTRDELVQLGNAFTQVFLPLTQALHLRLIQEDNNE